jgi:hypothetical protein
VAGKTLTSTNLYSIKNMARHKYFTEKTKGVFSTDALIVPETAMNLRNDCKEGKWFLGETEYGSKLKFICLKFSRRIAITEYGAIAPGTPLGQVWFCPVAAGESPKEA